MKTLIKLIAVVALAGSAFGQLTTTSTTLSGAIAANTNTDWCLASATGVVLPSLSGATNGSYLIVGKEAAQVTGQGGSSTCFKVKRGQLGSAASYAHRSGAKVWVGNAATSSGDTSRPFNGAIVAFPPTGSCTASEQYTLPVIYMGAALNNSGGVYTCAGGLWGKLFEQYVPPTQCTFAPTTLTTTNTYIQVGASNEFVLNGLSNAAAGTNTLVCTILPPVSPLSMRGAVLVDITLFVGSQTTAPTSLGTSTLGTITFPTAASSQTASTVTPVAVGGTVTTTSPSQITTVTTAGSFLTIKHTYATPIVLNTDLQVLSYTMPFVQSAAAAMALNTPGLIVHYLLAE